jgi:hypothetical protein
MSAAISNEVAELRAREMAALDPAERSVLIALGILSGVVVDARKEFERPITVGPLRFASDLTPWPSPPRCA